VVLLGTQQFVQHKILVQIVLHAFLISWAIPKRSSHA